ncbi:MAG TPA: xanthine dehydrogenase family protein molybdopterin-binding subunit [Acetobacteraceae bacterium]|nr:xanthine dehydrogenase family protein molybdopterin-binding subunit [Acetobacteraceae bacterium]
MPNDITASDAPAQHARRFRGRREDARFLTGAGRYSSDVDMAGQLHAVFVRSPHAHARIRAISTEAAAAAPGVAAILTGDDTAALQTLLPHLPFAGRGGSKLIAPERPPLARGAVRYAGEEVAVVIAATRAEAADAAERVEVEYEELDPVVGVDAAIAPGAPQLHATIPGNVCFEFEYGDAQATAAAIDAAPHVVGLAVDSPRVAPNPMEPRAVLAWWEADRGAYAIRCSNQGVNEMSGGLGRILSVDPADIRVQMVDVGGGFGQRGAPYAEYAVLLFAAKRLGRPVKWVSTRSDDFLVDCHGRGIKLSGELALDNDGNFLALRTRWLCDQGAYLTGGGTLTNCLNGQLMAAGAYRTRHMHGEHRLVMTNAVPVNAYRGAARPESAYFVERLVDEAAARLGIDPMELRRRNVLDATQMPYRTPTGSVFDSGDFPNLLAIAARASDWDGFPARRDEAAERGRLRGIGCAVFLEPAGGGAAPKDQVAIRFTPNARLHMFIPPTSSGQGHETVFAELIGDWLGIDPDAIDLRAGDPDGPRLIGGGAFGSRSTMVQGSVLKVTTDKIIRKGLRLASNMLEAAEADIGFDGGRYTVRGTDRSVTMMEVVRRHGDASPHPLDTQGELTVPRAFPSGAHVAELEVDPETVSVAVVSYVAADDAGRVINHTLAQGQVQGGVVQGAGQVFGERCLYDPASGQLVTGSFMDYVMPRAGLMPGVEVIDASVRTPNNVLGAKGVGESGTVGAAPTLVNALMSALRPAGVVAFDMPATPDRVWAALQR